MTQPRFAPPPGRAAAWLGWLVGLGWLVAVAAGAARAAEPAPLPRLAARVTDLAGVLTAAQRAALEERLAAFERERGTQMAVLLVASTRPEPIEAYAIRLAEAWKIGRKGIDDGVILVVASADRALRIEVGYGLEGVVTDAAARRIIDEAIVPRFRQGDTFGGLEAGIEALQRAVAGEPPPPPAGAGAWTMSMEDGGAFTQIVIGVAIVAAMLRALIGRLAAGLLAAGVGGGAAWYFSGSWALGGLLALILFVGVALGSVGGVSRGGRGGRGGWGGPSGGGFSGGGGGFGGGGASGRW